VPRNHQTERRLAAHQFRRASGDRLNLMHPAFNLREIAKQLLLLEDHLQHHYCSDCIRKHLLTIEAFAEEAQALDTGNLYGGLPAALAEVARQAIMAVADAQDSYAIRDLGQKLRSWRKKLVPLVYDPRGVEARKRLAAVYLSRGNCTHDYLHPDPVRWGRS